MLKKLLAMAAASVMMLSCFGAVAQAEYGYDYWELICGRSKTTAHTPLANYRTYMQGSYHEADMDTYYFYDETGRLNNGCYAGS